MRAARRRRMAQRSHRDRRPVAGRPPAQQDVRINHRSQNLSVGGGAANAIVGDKRIISKLEARVKDMELEIGEEKRRHAETTKLLREREQQLQQALNQCEEDQRNIALLQESLEKCTQQVNLYKKKLTEQEGMPHPSVTRVRRFQRELEEALDAAVDRAEVAESDRPLVRANICVCL